MAEILIKQGNNVTPYLTESYVADKAEFDTLSAKGRQPGSAVVILSTGDIYIVNADATGFVKFGG